MSAAKFVRLFAILILILCSPFTYGQRPTPNKGEWKFSFLTFFQSQTIHRGALIWSEPSIFPIFGVEYSDWFRIRGGPQIYQTYGNLEIGIGPRFFSDNEPLIPLSSKNEDFRNSRKTSIEINPSLSLKLPYKVQASIEYAKGVKAHFGNYGKTSMLVPLIPGFPFLKIGFSLGFGDKKHNRYLFGEGAKSGRVHDDFVLSGFFPFLPWNGVLITSFTRSWISQRKNRDLEHTRSEDKAQSFLLMVKWPL